MYTVSKSRSILKTVSWRFVATMTTVALVFLFIGKTEVALTIGIVEVILKMIFYFFHERLWHKIKFGKHEIEPFVVWLTGLSRSGKTDIGNVLCEKLRKKGLKVQRLDGHNVRTIFTETGFTPDKVNDHIRRIGYLSSILERQGIFVVASFLSPYEESRKFVRELSNNFVEVHVSTPLEVCKNRDTSGLYNGAIDGEIKNLPGIDIRYEEPKNPDITVDITHTNPDSAAQEIFNYLNKFIK